MSYAINEISKLPSGVEDLNLGEDLLRLMKLARYEPEAILGGFWEIDVRVDNWEAGLGPSDQFRGVGFLSGIDTKRVVEVFYFIRFPMVRNTEILIVKQACSIHRMRRANAEDATRSSTAGKQLGSGCQIRLRNDRVRMVG